MFIQSQHSEQESELKEIDEVQVEDESEDESNSDSEDEEEESRAEPPQEPSVNLSPAEVEEQIKLNERLIKQLKESLDSGLKQPKN